MIHVATEISPLWLLAGCVVVGWTTIATMAIIGGSVAAATDAAMRIKGWVEGRPMNPLDDFLDATKNVTIGGATGALGGAVSAVGGSVLGAGNAAASGAAANAAAAGSEAAAALPAGSLGATGTAVAAGAPTGGGAAGPAIAEGTAAATQQAASNAVGPAVQQAVRPGLHSLMGQPLAATAPKGVPLAHLGTAKLASAAASPSFDVGAQGAISGLTRPAGPFLAASRPTQTLAQQVAGGVLGRGVAGAARELPSRDPRRIGLGAAAGAAGGAGGMLGGLHSPLASGALGGALSGGVAGLSDSHDPARGALAGAAQGLASGGLSSGLGEGYESLREKQDRVRWHPTAEADQQVSRSFGRSFNRPGAEANMVPSSRLTSAAQDSAVTSGIGQVSRMAGNAIGRALNPPRRPDPLVPTSGPAFYRHLYSRPGMGLHRRLV